MAKGNLDNDIQRLIIEAKNSDVTNTDIDKCLDEALREFIRSNRNVCNRACSFSLKAFVCAVIILGVFGAVVASSEDVQKALTPYVISHASVVQRAVRKLSIALSEPFGRFEWHKWYDADCMIENPFKEPLDDTCYPCDEGSVVMTSQLDQDTFTQEFYQQRRPVKTHNSNNRQVTFTDIQRSYGQFANLSQMGDNWIESNNTESTSVVDFMRTITEKQIAEADDFHAVWHMKRAGPSAFLRKFLPNPMFLPRDCEINLHQLMVLDSPRSREKRLSVPPMPCMFYMQGYGQREIVLMPPQHCADACGNMTVTMKAGDMLYIDALYWSIVTKPNPSSDNMHISMATIISII